VHWNSLPKETSAPILIVDPGEAARLAKDLGDRYRSRRFAVRGWWQIEWDKMTPGTLLRFLIERRVWNPVGTTDAVMMVAKDLHPNQSLASIPLRAAPPAREYSGDAARPSGRVIGSPGSAAGQFAEPAGLAFDGDGNLLVADSKNHRIQKLSPDGQVLAVWGGPDAGEDAAHFRQPCGVAAAPDGSIYVADTWNHRIVKLDRSGRYLLDWREQDPGFWGPRAVAVAANGSVFVADTGNKRVLAYDPTGRKLFAIGGEGSEPGKLIEPVGLAIDDKAGTLYVADTGNHRVQSFDLAGKPRLAWPVFGWQEFYTEPYLAWHAGELWATDSYNHRVNAYEPLGALLRSIDGATGAPRLGRPTGIAIAADGRIFLSDATENHLAVLDNPPR
jgi:DNA-binding beta-propeller fold protein YncE